jgi:hypothetical protein
LSGNTASGLGKRRRVERILLRRFNFPHEPEHLAAGDIILKMHETCQDAVDATRAVPGYPLGNLLGCAD